MNINQSFSRVSDDNNISKTPIYLNVYNFWSCFNKICGLINVGVYHTGIQIFDDQYLFFGFEGDQTGVGFIQPYTAAYQFSQQILLGYTSHSYYEFDQVILDLLRQQFTGNKYDLLNNNCNHFSKRMAQALKVQNNFPQKVFSVTNCFNNLRFCIPNCILNGRLDWFSSDEQESFESDGCPEGYKELNEEIHRKSESSSRVKKLNQNKSEHFDASDKSLKQVSPANTRVEVKDYTYDYNNNKIQVYKYKQNSNDKNIIQAEQKQQTRRLIPKKPIFQVFNKNSKKEVQMKQVLKQ